MMISLNPQKSVHVMASHDGIGKSTTSTDPTGACDITCILRMHQEEIRLQLEQCMAQHEEYLQQALLTFQEALHSSIRALARQHSSRSSLSRPGPLLRQATGQSIGSIGSDTSHTTQPYQSSPDCSPKVRRATTSPTFTQSQLRTDSDSLPIQARSSESESIPEDALDSPLEFKRRPSLDSSASSCDGNYVSVQELRKQFVSNDSNDSGNKTPTNGTMQKKKKRGESIIQMVHSTVNSVSFELLFAFLISINSVLLGVEVSVIASSPKEEVPHFFYYSTLFFSIAFLIELILRLMDVGGLISFLFYSEQRAWNWFDLVVVLCSLIEVGFNFVLLGGGSQSVTRIMRMARMSRLGRVLRVARIVRFITQLRVLVISIVSTLQTLLWALFLLLIIIYVFAVLLAQATADYFSEDPGYGQESLIVKEERLQHYWGSLQAAMYTLFMSIAGGVSWETAVFVIADVHWVWGAFFTCFIAFSSFALVNVMTAVFCQSAIESAQRNVDVKWQAMCADKRKHIETLKRLFKSLEGNAKGTLSVKKLQRCWGDEAMQAFLNSMDLEPDDCWTFFAILDKQAKEVSASEFVEGCLRLKGYAKAFDMAVLTYELRHLSKQNITFMNRMQECMNSILDTVQMTSEQERPSGFANTVNEKQPSWTKRIPM